jgi:hypothetical protein
VSDIIDSKTQDAKLRAVKARDELAKTLDAIENKLNVPKRIGELTDTARASFSKTPVPWIIGGAAVAAVVIGLITWAIFSDD